jgi:large subunit ribosomal protein L5
MAVKAPAVTPRLRQRYDEEIRPRLMERFGLSSVMEAPRLEKITVNMGVGDAKQDSRMLEQATEQLATIAGQHPNVRRARKSIAGFKLRDGMPVGVAATLRGARMYEFLDRLTSLALPRVRDFRGLSPRAFDGRGNYSVGVREQIIFPEIDYDSIDQVRGLDVAITTTTDDDEQAFALLTELGMPFRREGGPGEAPVRSEADERGGPRPSEAVEPAEQAEGGGEAVAEDAAAEETAAGEAADAESADAEPTPQAGAAEDAS